VRGDSVSFFLLTTHHSLLTVFYPSHQTTKFPPTPSIHSTSPSHVRMINNSTITLTVIEIRATILYDSAPLHAPAFLPLTIHRQALTIFLCVRTATAATPIPSCVYFTTLWIPQGRGSPALLRDLFARRLSRPGRDVKIYPPLALNRSVRRPSLSTRRQTNLYL
jgi:hypothetical protein